MGRRGEGGRGAGAAVFILGAGSGGGRRPSNRELLFDSSKHVHATTSSGSGSDMACPPLQEGADARPGPQTILAPRAVSGLPYRGRLRCAHVVCRRAWRWPRERDGALVRRALRRGDHRPILGQIKVKLRIRQSSHSNARPADAVSARLDCMQRTRPLRAFATPSDSRSLHYVPVHSRGAVSEYIAVKSAMLTWLLFGNATRDKDPASRLHVLRSFDRDTRRRQLKTIEGLRHTVRVKVNIVLSSLSMLCRLRRVG